MAPTTRWRFVSKGQHRLQSIHVLRCLLRESTYLPDEAARAFTRSNIIQRFRKFRPRGRILVRAASDCDGPTQAEARQKLSEALQKGYKALYQLSRANEGELKPLLRILRHTYGRTGPRRYSLLHDLLTPQDADSLTDAKRAPQGADSLVADAKEVPRKWDITTVEVPPVFEPPSSIHKDTVRYSISPRYPKLRAVVASQRTLDVRSRENKVPDNFDIPAKNAWGRSMPRVRVANMMKLKYAALLSSVMPPLPLSEWQRLEKLANGTIPWQGQMQRRRRPKCCPDFLTQSDLEALAHISRHAAPAEAIEETDAFAGRAWLKDGHATSHAVDRILEDELSIHPLNKRLTHGERGHRLTPRFMRRLWTKILRTCPLLQWDEDRKDWRATWAGHEPLLEPSKDPSSNSAFRKELFGLITNGGQ